MTIPPVKSRLTRELVLTAAVVAIAGGTTAWAVKSRSNEVRSIASTLPRADQGSQKFQVFVFLDPVDCRHNVSFLRIFERDTANFQLRNLLLLGPADSLEVMTESLRAQGISAKLDAATPAQQRVPSLLGARGTPFVVIIDVDSVVRVAMYSPPNTVTYARFPELMRALVAQGLTDPLLEKR